MSPTPPDVCDCAKWCADQSLSAMQEILRDVFYILVAILTCVVVIGSFSLVTTAMCMLVLITGAYLLRWLKSINADQAPKQDGYGTGGERQRLLPGSSGFREDCGDWLIFQNCIASSHTGTVLIQRTECRLGGEYQTLKGWQGIWGQKTVERTRSGSFHAEDNETTA
ncbi:hypothetical protein BOTNAR_0034g00060 [Botryotinia narcissicola]|uniref:Uncharacterized protein n=1 Tax=Botryotinia narcissicola TaxID=278944 RepID=A0A4Z1JFW9_9HELO|nr:hypothetical protein BOTNAR_0034g00060 [Botryotinia narcissicola]